MVETGPRRAAAARRLAIVLIAGATAIGLLGLSAGRGALVPGTADFSPGPGVRSAPASGGVITATLDAAAATTPTPTAAVPGVVALSSLRLQLRPLASGLSDPVFVANAGDGSGRLFIVEQRGIVRIIRNGRLAATPFLDMRALVEAGGERGLLGLAFHPGYGLRPRLFVDFTERGTGDLVVAEFRPRSGNRDQADPRSFRQLLRIPHRVNANHNGGMLAFGPDGYLYIGTGDGGGAGDQPGNAPSLRSRLGKLLRIDVDGTTAGLAYRIPPTNPYATSTVAAREIWARGLRNPWRFSFDRATGDLWIGDVGQDRFEEVDRAQRAVGGGRGWNYGWNRVEGDTCFAPTTACVRTGLRAPLATYGHDLGCAVIGGYVYRGPSTPLRGAYLFSDACSGRIWAVMAAGAARQRPVLLAASESGPSSFGEGEDGSLYLVGLNGMIYRVTANLR